MLKTPIFLQPSGHYEHLAMWIEVKEALENVERELV